MWILGIVVVAVALLAVAAWYRSFNARSDPGPPELRDDGPAPPPDRDETWDPRERYDEPPEALT